MTADRWAEKDWFGAEGDEVAPIESSAPPWDGPDWFSTATAPETASIPETATADAAAEPQPTTSPVAPDDSPTPDAAVERHPDHPPTDEPETTEPVEPDEASVDPPVPDEPPAIADRDRQVVTPEAETEPPAETVTSRNGRRDEREATADGSEGVLSGLVTWLRSLLG